MIVYLRVLFFGYTCCLNVVKFKVGKQTKRCEIVIHKCIKTKSWSEEFHQPQNNVFSYSLFSRGGNPFPFFAPVWTEIQSRMSLQQGHRFYIPLESTCCLFVAYFQEFRRSESFYGFVLPVEREFMKSPIWLNNYGNELREFVLFYALETYGTHKPVACLIICEFSH